MTAYSNSRIAYHSSKIKDLKQGNISAPIQLRIKPINSCNHDCFFCAYAKDSRKRKFSDEVIDHIDTKMHGDTNLTDRLSTAELLNLLKEASEYGVKSVTFTGGGEPLLHPGILEALRVSHEYGLNTSLITNGSLMNKEGMMDELLKATWVRISIDYTNARQMSLSRNINEEEFSRIISNIQRLCELKKKNSGIGPEVGINYIVHKNNIDGISDLVKVLDSIGADNIRFSPMWVPDFAEYHRDISGLFKEEFLKSKACVKRLNVFSSYNLDSSIHYPTRPLKRCYIQELVPVVGADGGIYRCHHTAFTEAGYIGSIKNKSFKEAWIESYCRIEDFDCKKVCSHQCVYDDRNLEISHLVSSSISSGVDSEESDIADKFINFI